MTSDFERRAPESTEATGSPADMMAGGTRASMSGSGTTTGNNQSGFGEPLQAGQSLPTVESAFGQRGVSGQDASSSHSTGGVTGSRDGDRGRGDKDRFANAIDRETGSARAELGSATDKVREGISSLGDTAREKAYEGVEKGKSQITSGIGDFAAAVRKASDELGERDQSMAAGLVREVANGLEQATGAIEGRSVQDLTRSVAAFARRQPTTFLIGAALAGIALGRFARASGEHEHGPADRGRSEREDGRRFGASGGRDRYGEHLYRNDGGETRYDGRTTPGRDAVSTPVSPPVSAGTTAARSTFSGGSTHAGSASPAATSPDKAPAEGPSGAVLGHGSGSFNPQGGRDVR